MSLWQRTIAFSKCNAVSCILMFTAITAFGIAVIAAVTGSRTMLMSAVALSIVVFAAGLIDWVMG